MSLDLTRLHGRVSSPTVRCVRDLSSVDPAGWDALDHGGSPFLEHGFLRALELSHSIAGTSGWDPHYLLAEVAIEPEEAAGADSARRPSAPSVLVGAVPCFVKDHSYGEYIFDFAWASASARGRIPYYPKLVVAAPVTPATGPRILLHRDLAETKDAVESALVTAVRDLADDLDCHSIHWLFTTEREHDRLGAHGFLPRTTLQYHFHNPGYADFDAFLAALASRKRKQIRKERARAQAEVDSIDFVQGPDLGDDDVAAMERFYRRTTLHHGGHAYLRPGFFARLRETAAPRMAFARARKRGKTIAGALYLEGDGALYGRYWGCDEQVPLLHFELAVYQGIERCLTRKLPLFEAGAQGEHKLLRGFEPTRTFSSHWIRHEGLHKSVERFLAEERRSTMAVVHELEQLLPYRVGGSGEESG
jgi:predicted N-acyltransferase